ncbi:hypothetical protein ES708_08009 [subsurface metagenome]
MKIGAVVLARSNFGRWPGKIKADLFGKPMIERVVERLKKLKGLDEIILSTTDYSEDKWLMNLAGQYAIQYITGPPDDRGLRYYEAVMKYDLDYFVAAPANYPLFDIEAQNELIQEVRTNPRYEVYKYGNWGSKGIIIDVCNKQIIKRYKKEGTDQELGWITCKNKFTIHDWKEPELRNKYLIDLNIAYPLHLALLNKVIEHIGYYPERYEEIVKAFMEMETL